VILGIEHNVVSEPVAPLSDGERYAALKWLYLMPPGAAKPFCDLMAGLCWCADCYDASTDVLARALHRAPPGRGAH
jgi:hypothetical protein